MHHILHRTGGKDHPNRKYSQKPFLNTSMQSGDHKEEGMDGFRGKQGFFG